LEKISPLILVKDPLKTLPFLKPLPPEDFFGKGKERKGLYLSHPKIGFLEILGVPSPKKSFLWRGFLQKGRNLTLASPSQSVPGKIGGS